MLLFSQTSVPPVATTLIASYVVPTRSGAYAVNFNGIRAWANADGEYWIYRNGVLLIGGRTSGAEPTLMLDWSSVPVGCIGGDILLVYVSHHESTPITFNCSMLIDLV
jgi:hypothetical protein